MQRILGGPPPADVLRGAVVAMGNFDGFHRGHQAVIGHAARQAQARSAALAVLTFDPHPARFFRPDLPPFALMTLAAKLRALEDFGVDRVVVLPFDAALAATSPEAFGRDFLIAGQGAAHLVAGFDFTFGARRAGDMALLGRLAAPLGVGVDAVPPVLAPDGKPYSSTGVRDALRAGEPQAAALLLGRPWRISGPVQTGDQRGRTIGFPTANLWLGDYVRPKLGVYAVRVQVEGGGPWYDGVANIGRRPTFDKTDETLEVFLFDFSGDLYGRPVDIDVIEFIRAERKFDGLAALKDQIAVDSASALKILRQPGHGRTRCPVPHRRQYEQGGSTGCPA